MSTTIRLARMGKKKRPFYRLVAMDNRKQRDGKYIANLGYYNPFVEPFVTSLHDDEIIAWLKNGATVSATARSLLQGQGLLLRFALEKQGVPAEEISRKLDEWRQGSAARVATRAELEASKKAARVAALAAEAKAAADAKAAAEAQAAAEAAAAAAAAAEAAAAAPAEASEPPVEGNPPADAS